MADDHAGDAPAEPADSEELGAEYAQLGRGGRGDQLGFRVVVRLLLRCLPLLRPVARPLTGLVVATVLLVLALFVPGTNVINIFWNAILEDRALTGLQATMLWLPADPYTTAETLAPEERRTVMRHLVAFGVAGFVFFTPLFLGLYYWRVWILQQINQHLRLQIFDRLQSLSLRFHSEQRVGDSIYRMTQDSAVVTMLIDVLFITPIEALGRFVFSLGVVALWDPWMALLLLAIWPGVLGLGALYSRPMRRGFRRARETNSALTSRIQETLVGIRVIKAYGAEGREQARFEDASGEAFEAAATARMRFATFKVLGFVVLGAVVVGAVGWATWLTAEGRPLYAERFFVVLGFTAVNSGVWDLGLYSNFKERFGDGANAVRKIVQLWAQLQDIATGLDRVFELIDLEPDVEDAPGAVPMPPFRESIAFRGVGFGYRRRHRVLDDVHLRADTGSITAIVGPTGSGKSTLMALLLRLYDPDEGRIEIDGRDIRDFRIQSLRDHISIALQENLLFGTTVRENIRYAAPEADDAAVREAARVACADGFIETLPHGYDTLLGERGTKLSTGQRQRLSIARAVLKDTPILILDEPTASLDASTELQVLENLAEWGRGRAIFLITHRLSTIRRADRVAVMRRGRLVECGSHEELMAHPGVYQGLISAERDQAAAALGGGG